ncbi:MAG: hypothetical protein KDA45_13930 [Planctomycetales bacterium]|nr:hypothetical protein [Planctomycetales bacterium]
MSCVHLKKLYALCTQEELKISGAELVHFVCTQCGEQEVCPSLLMEEYEALQPQESLPPQESGEGSAAAGQGQASNSSPPPKA